MILLAVAAAGALTLEETVARAREVHPEAVATALEWRAARAEAGATWSALAVEPELQVERRWLAGTTSRDGQLRVTTPVFDAAGWFDALEQSAQARSARWVADGTALDAQYAAAALYFEALAAEGWREAARAYAVEAEATLATARARVDAGYESPLALRVAEVHVLDARAEVARAESTVVNARDRLGRAIEREVDALTPASVAPPPLAPSTSPWIAAHRAQADAARFERAQSWAELLPTAELEGATLLGAPDWTATLQATWTIDGAGPLFRARAAALAARAADTRARGLQLDGDLAVRTGREDARSLDAARDAAIAREALAAEALAIGQARFAVGLLDALDVIQLQRDLARARTDAVDATLEHALVVLEARRLAGIAW